MDSPSLSLSKEAIEEALSDKNRELKKCDKCDYTTKGALMYQHMNIKHSGKSFKCDDCDTGISIEIKLKVTINKCTKTRKEKANIPFQGSVGKRDVQCFQAKVV